MRKLKVLPSMQCDQGCGDCCTLAPVTETEYRSIERFAKERNIVPRDQGLTCPFYQDETCAIYEARPLICRLFGHSPALECVRGYNVNIDLREERRMVASNGVVTRFIHDLIPGYTESIDREMAAARFAGEL